MGDDLDDLGGGELSLHVDVDVDGCEGCRPKTPPFPSFIS